MATGSKKGNVVTMRPHFTECNANTRMLTGRTPGAKVALLFTQIPADMVFAQ